MWYAGESFLRQRDVVVDRLDVCFRGRVRENVRARRTWCAITTLVGIRKRKVVCRQCGTSLESCVCNLVIEEVGGRVMLWS